jgi:hypothetical protein
MQFWGVPQAASANDKNQVPTGEQFLLMCTIYIIEGAVGLMTWNDKMNFSPDVSHRLDYIFFQTNPIINSILTRFP